MQNTTIDGVTLELPVRPVRIADVLNLPKRRGIVMRAEGLADSYGKKYYRMPDGSLRRIESHTRG